MWFCFPKAKLFTVMRNKEQLTRYLIELLPQDSRPDYKSAFFSWWYNTREKGGMRLTSTGFSVMKKLEFEYWNFELPKEHRRKNKRIILGLDRNLQWPYYYGTKQISFFSSRDAMMANLVGNLEQWLKNSFDS